MKKQKVVIITGPKFEDVEVTYPYYRLQEAGFVVDVATSTDGEVFGKHGNPISPTVKLKNLRQKDYAAAIIPGGHEAPDRVRQKIAVLKFLKALSDAGKIISSTCHGPWVLISAGLTRGIAATCYVGMKDDLINSGAIYKNVPVVVSGNIITSDHPRNMPAWMAKTIELLTKNISG